MNVAVLGASPKRERFSNQAVRLLKEFNHDVFPINPGIDTIEGLKAYKELKNVPHPLHTITVYIGPQNIGPLIPSILEAKPKRVIMNPGAESKELKEACENNNIEVVEHCTLIMLRTDEF